MNMSLLKINFNLAMKKLISFIFFALVLTKANAQVVVNVQAKPQGPAEFISSVPSFSFTEPIKLVVDVSGVPNLVGVEPIYLWGFIQGCCGAPTNGDFCDSNEASRMTKESSNVWSIIIPSVKSYMGVGFKTAKDAAIAQGRPSDQTRFGFLVKRDNGCGGFQSNDMSIPFTGPVYIKTEFEQFPANAAQTDVITLTYNQDLENDATMKNQTEVYLYATADLMVGGSIEPFTPAEVGNTASLKFVKNGSQYTISIIPDKFFDLQAGQQIDKINILIRSKSDNNINFGPTQNIRMVKLK
jgi:Domain of unknown function (DUF4961)